MSRKSVLSRTISQQHATAVTNTKSTLQRLGFGSISEIDVARLVNAGEAGAKAHVVVRALNVELATRSLPKHPDAALLLWMDIAVRKGEDGTVIETLDPTSSPLVNDPEVSPLLDDMRARADLVLETVANARESEQDESAGSSASADAEDVEVAKLAEAVERKLLERIGSTVEQLNTENGESADQLLQLAKAFTAIASLRRAEEVELHIA